MRASEATSKSDLKKVVRKFQTAEIRKIADRVGIAIRRDLCIYTGAEPTCFYLLPPSTTIILLFISMPSTQDEIAAMEARLAELRRKAEEERERAEAAEAEEVEAGRCT